MKKIKHILGRYPLWLQCSTLFAVVTLLIVSSLITNLYKFNKNTVIASQVEHKKEVLALELDSVAEYVRELSTFTIQPLYDSTFSRILETHTEVSEEELDYMKTQMQDYYYTRNDLTSYHIFFPTLDFCLGRGHGVQHILMDSLQNRTDFDEESFALCDASPYYNAVRPSHNPRNFFTFYHSIIDIRNRQPLAYVKCELNQNFLTALLRSYAFSEEEVLLLYNDRAELLYTGDPAFKGISLNTLLTEEAEPSRRYQMTLNNQSYMVVSQKDEQYGFTMISLQPYRVINQSLYRLLLRFLLQGTLILAVSVLLIYISCRKLMQPLDELSNQLKKVGEGAFHTKVNIGGSREIRNLEKSFNYMSEHITTLIEENYLVTLNEQAARLIALEAQINPHFLYNTLQAISTEALINEQEQIHEMIISLASMLRYSIKGGDLVTLAEEVEHVKKYIYLQKIRMDESLQTDIAIQTEANTCLIPKISIQTMVENCIVHGIDGDVTSIAIKIQAYVKDDRLHLSVTDNGCGMDEETLQSLRSSFTGEKIAGVHTQGIGLANLYDRLRILYDRGSEMIVESKEGHGTSIHITLPVKRGTHE